MSATSVVRCEELPSPPLGRQGWPWHAAAPPPLPEGPLPRISVVVPSFNQGEFIEETLRSVLLQGYPSLELIVVDGGSRDRTAEVLARYRPWLKDAVSEPDRGQSHAINKGLARSSGELVTFIGSDDLLLEGALVHVASRWPDLRHAGAIVGGVVFLDETSRVVGGVQAPRIPHAGPLDLSVLDLGAYRLHQVSTLFVRSALDAVGRHVREDLHYTMDREVLYRVARSFPIVTTPRPLGAFRRHADAKSGSAILPFAREFARLHSLLPPTTPDGARRRARNARLHLYRGRLKHARALGPGPGAVLSLVRALVHRPSAIFAMDFAASWLGALGLARLVAAGRSLRARVRAQDGVDR